MIIPWVQKDVEKLEHLHIANGDVNWNCPEEGQLNICLPRIKCTFGTLLEISTDLKQLKCSSEETK